MVLGAMFLATAAFAESVVKQDAAKTATSPRQIRPATSPAAQDAKDLKFPPLNAIQVPTPAIFTLPNGMKILLVEDHDLPLIQGAALIRTGGVFDPPERIGLAQMAGIALRNGGIVLKTGEQLDATLDDLAATLDVNIDQTSGRIAFSTLKENSDAILVLLKELMVQPGYRRDAVERARAQLRAEVANRNTDPPSIAHREFAGLVLGKDTPYGRVPQYGTVNHISRDDLRAFHERYFFPANVTLGLVGDFDSAQFRAFLEKLFADWNPKQAPVPELPTSTHAASPGIFLAERKEMSQAFFSVGHPVMEPNLKDRAALEILCGGLQRRLERRLRTIGIRNRIAASLASEPNRPGMFEVSGSTNSASVYETVQAVREELDRVRAAELGEDELRATRDAALNTLAIRFDAKSKMLEHVLQAAYFGRATDELQQYQKALESATRADVLRAARQFIDPAKLTQVVAGNAAFFGDALEKLGGPVVRLDLTIPEPKPAAAASTDLSLAEGKRILARAQAASGGAEKLAAIKDCSVLTEYSIDPAIPNIGGAKLPQTDRWIAPSIFRQDATFPTGLIALYTDTKFGWIGNTQGWRPLAGVDRTRALGDLFRVYFRLLLSDRLEGRTVSAIDANTVQISDASGEIAMLEFDPDTGLPRVLAYDSAQASGPPIYSEETYTDFRDVDGVKLPFAIAINQGGRKFASATVKEYKMNSGLKPLDLARRPQ
jgi:zinc protease